MSIKRKSLHGRKLRPKSVVDSVDGLSADDIPSLLPSKTRNSEEEDSVTELPNATHQLQHLVKGKNEILINLFLLNIIQFLARTLRKLNIGVNISIICFK